MKDLGTTSARNEPMRLDIYLASFLTFEDEIEAEIERGWRARVIHARVTND